MAEVSNVDVIGRVQFDEHGVCTMAQLGKLWMLSRADVRRLINMLEAEKSGDVTATLDSRHG